MTIMTVEREEFERLERQLAEARAALGAIRSSLPDDPGLNKPWSPAIAIIDEALAAAKEQKPPLLPWRIGEPQIHDMPNSPTMQEQEERGDE